MNETTQEPQLHIRERNLQSRDSQSFSRESRYFNRESLSRDSRYLNRESSFIFLYNPYPRKLLFDLEANNIQPYSPISLFNDYVLCFPLSWINSFEIDSETGIPKEMEDRTFTIKITDGKLKYHTYSYHKQ